jgi:hypothetical protein
MEEIRYTIYKLTDPVTNDVRYIGLTFNTLKQRLDSHMSEKSKSHKSNWIQKLKSQGLKPLIESVEENISSYDECCDREIHYIDYYKEIGCNLTNSATGGNKNKKMSVETRKLMSESRKNSSFKLVLSDVTKKVLSEKAIERFKDDNERERLRISNKKYEDSKTEEQKLNDILIQKESKKVLKYDRNMNFICDYPSIGNASKLNCLASTNISKCCKHKVRMVGGFVWRFEGDVKPPEYKIGYKEVIKCDISGNYIDSYKNASIAGKENDLLGSNISLCCKGGRIQVGGFIWKYKE